jgi:hypothetical protein
MHTRVPRVYVRCILCIDLVIPGHVLAQNNNDEAYNPQQWTDGKLHARVQQIVAPAHQWMTKRRLCAKSFANAYARWVRS